MRIGIFGCSADPFTLAHLAIVDKASEEFDQVYIVPTTCDYYRRDKSPMFSFDDKRRIIQQMLMGLPNGNIHICEIERNQDSKWRTVNTVERFWNKHKGDDLYLIIGGDSYENFGTWFRYEDILQMAKLCVVPRSGKEIPEGSNVAKILKIKDDLQKMSASEVRNRLLEEIIDTYLSDVEWYNKETE